MTKVTEGGAAQVDGRMDSGDKLLMVCHVAYCYVNYNCYNCYCWFLFNRSFLHGRVSIWNLLVWDFYRPGATPDAQPTV